MEDVNKLWELSETYPKQLEEMCEECLLKLRVILWGQAAIIANKEKTKNLPAASPQQSKKRIRRLSLLNEDSETEDKLLNPSPCTGKSSQKNSKRSNSELLAASETIVDDNNSTECEPPVAAPRTPRTISATNNTDLGNVTQNDLLRNSEATNLMPPPPAPATIPADDTLNKRPQRAAKIKSEKNLKEPPLNRKIRRPTSEDVKIKLEHEHRASQIIESTIKSTVPKLAESDVAVAKTSLTSQKSDDSILLIPGKQPSIVSLVSDVEDVPAVALDDQQTSKEQKKSSDSRDSAIREIRIKIKREKVSLDKEENLIENLPEKDVFKAPMPLVRNEKSATLEESTLTNSILSSTTNTTTTAPAKKTRSKKPIVHKPIKVERFSDVDPNLAPVSSRTRNCSTSKTDGDETPSNKEAKRPGSIYEDAVETPPPSNSKEINNATVSVDIVNETVNLGPAADATMNLGPVPGDATFSTNPAQTTFQVAPGRTTFDSDANPNATVTLNKELPSDALCDATFDVQHGSKVGKNKDDTVGQRSFETAKDSSMPNDDSLMTEEDEKEKPIVTRSKVSTTSNKAKGAAKASSAAKAVYKVPTRTNELFNPLVQSPVKLRVEAFENAAAAATEQSRRPLRSRKENLTPATVTTPVIGKLAGPALGRFLTPTQTSNLGPVSSALGKKVATSASKAIPMTKAISASTLQRSNSNTSTKALQRENSVDDFRKDLHKMAEERKKQREQKHLLAAQQREAKERERAERMAKLAKEREEKRLLKKQQEQEQKKRELEEIHRKLRQQQEDEAAKMKAAKEREMLLQMKQQQLAKQKMMPPPPKITSKYTFEMLHEDDSTDDEDKVSYKRPPPPSWSRSHVRSPFMLKQEYTPAAYIDSFFSVQPMTPDLKIIFPNIEARYLKRNSSVLWSTPPRYSELPKY